MQVAGTAGGKDEKGEGSGRGAGRIRHRND